MFSDHNGNKVEISGRKITGKSLYTQKLNNALWIKKDASRGIKKIDLNVLTPFLNKKKPEETENQ